MLRRDGKTHAPSSRRLTGSLWHHRRRLPNIRHKRRFDALRQSLAAPGLLCNRGPTDPRAAGHTHALEEAGRHYSSSAVPFSIRCRWQLSRPLAAGPGRRMNDRRSSHGLIDRAKKTCRRPLHLPEPGAGRRPGSWIRAADAARGDTHYGHTRWRRPRARRSGWERPLRSFGW